MNGNAAIDVILARIGRWGATDLRASALVELNMVQQEYEHGPLLPWFLFVQKTAAVLLGTNSVALPAGFIRFEEDSSAAWYVDADGIRQFLEIVGFQTLIEQGLADGVPTACAIADELYVYPSPESDTTVTVLAAYKDSAITDAAATNLWLTNLSYLLVAKTALRMAQSYLQDFELAKSLTPLAQEAEMRAARFITARQVARTDVVKGEY